MALTRIVELVSGSIEIDGLDISTVGIARLRNEITMIPQDPIMFTGTLRYNLDPFEESTDEKMTELIKKSGLEYLLEGVSKKELKDKEEKEAKEKARKELLGEESSSSESEDEKNKKEKEEAEKKKKQEEEVKAKVDKKDEKSEEADKKNKRDEEEDGKGLKFKVQEEGKNLSIGERQLICIIRAILRCNKIVILDEATANIDVVTEQAIQKLINEEFKGATVICIAHRLNTIIKSDKVLVMGAGQALEYDTPQALMADKSSVFSNML